MLSSGMFACTEPRSARGHARLPSLPRASTAHFRFSREGSNLVGKGHQPPAPALRRGRARTCASSVFSATPAISVFGPALSPKNPSFVFIRLRTLPFSVYNIFPFKLFAFNPFRTLSRNTGGGYQLFPKWNSPLSTHSAPTYSSSFFSHSCALFGAMGATQPFWNQFVPHSFYRNGGGGVLFPHPEGDADPEKRSAEGPLKFCLWDFVSRPFRLPLSAAAFGSLRVFA